MTETEDLPENWKLARSSNYGLFSKTYHHEYVDISVNLAVIEEFGDRDRYAINLSWTSDSVRVDGCFDLDNSLIPKEEAKNWAYALMAQLNIYFEPKHSNYVTRAKQATRGESIENPKIKSVPESQRCPVCGEPLSPFRGFSNYEQAVNHFKYLDDDSHKNAEISLEQITD